jgi:hypothetical protein
MSRKGPSWEDFIALQQMVIGVQDTVNNLAREVRGEDRESHKSGFFLLPKGTYEVTILDVEQKTSQRGRAYWSIKLGDVEGHPNKLVWANTVFRFSEPLERLFSISTTSDDEQRRVKENRGLIAAIDIIVRGTVGMRARADIGLSSYSGRTMNEVTKLAPI